MIRTLVDYYRCPEEFATCLVTSEPSPEAGFFRFGPEAICYGGMANGNTCSQPDGALHDAMDDTAARAETIYLGFDPDEAVEGLRFERYCASSRNGRSPTSGLAARAYYLVRPFLGLSVRRRVQRFRARGWQSIPFPHWPVDRTVEQIHETLLRLCLQTHHETQIPFVWFWPDGFSSCLCMTHDVETATGRDFCSSLMELDEVFGIKSSFQLIPEDRYSLTPQFLDAIRRRGFEVNVHDLNHDGRLFASKEKFLERAQRINEYARAFGARGFRSGAMYRNLDWYGALEFSYDMSVPNAAHLDPQCGGCCTVMPYFVGDTVELPLTTTQDYFLFHILNDYSLTLWRRQLEIIGNSHGAAIFNIHPDYVIEPRARSVYVQLLQHLAQLRAEGRTWFALSGEVERWWRSRTQMRIVRRGGEWAIEGPESHRARIAYARLQENELEYSLSSLAPVSHEDLLDFPEVRRCAW